VIVHACAIGFDFHMRKAIGKSVTGVKLCRVHIVVVRMGARSLTARWPSGEINSLKRCIKLMALFG
jgi:hypothetical protein